MGRRRSLVVVAAGLILLGAVRLLAQAALPDLPDTRLEISWEDFKALVEAAGDVEPPSQDPPQEAFLRSAEYRGRLEPGVLRLDGTLRLEVLKEGWVSVPLWAREHAVLAFSGGAATLAATGSANGVLVEGPGTFALEASIALAAPDNPGENRMDLLLPGAPVNVIDLVAADGIADLEVESALVVGRRPNGVRLALQGGRAGLRWRRPFSRGAEAVGEEIERESRVHLNAYQMLDVGEGSIGGLLVLDYDIRVAEIGDFDLLMPPEIEVFNVTAPGLDSWKVLRREGSRVLHLALAAPVQGDLRAVVSFEGTYEPESGGCGVPRFEPLAVERETGFVSVSAEGAEIELTLGEGVLPADPSELPGNVQALGGNPVAVCKFSASPGPIRVGITEHADAPVLTAVIERLNATTVVLEDGTEALWLELGLRNNRKQFLKLALPDSEVDIWSLLVDGEPARPKRSGDLVLIPLPRGGAETAGTISLVMLREGRPVRAFRRIQPALPLFDVPVSEAMWTVYLPPDRRYAALKSAFTPVVETSPLGRRGRGGSWMSGVASTSLDYAAAPMSEEIVAKQKKQEADAFAEMKNRQGAMRRGALPVRIQLPGGVTSLPKIAAARVLMVDDSPARLPIRAYPGWLKDLMTWADVFCVGLVCLLLGFWRRERPRFLAAAGVLVVLSLILPGGPGLAGILTLAVVFGLTIQAGRYAVRWWKARATVKKEPHAGPRKKEEDSNMG